MAARRRGGRGGRDRGDPPRRGRPGSGRRDREEPEDDEPEEDEEQEESGGSSGVRRGVRRGGRDTGRRSDRGGRRDAPRRGESRRMRAGGSKTGRTAGRGSDRGSTRGDRGSGRGSDRVSGRGGRDRGRTGRDRGRGGRRPVGRSKTERIKLPGKSEKEKEQERLDELQHDLNVATEIQSNLLPKKIPRIPGFDISAYYKPSKDVGGDYYDFIELEEGKKLAIVVADVSGKGVAGSMVMAMFRSVLRMHTANSDNAADPLSATNKQMAQDIKRGMFVTCLFMVVDTEERTVRLCSAGHNPLLYYRAKSGKCHKINPNGIAIGFDKGPVFDRSIQEQAFRLEPGDRIVAYTDGIVEAMNDENEEYEEERLIALMRQYGDSSSGQFVNRVLESMADFVGDAPQSDDITMVSLRIKPDA